MAAIPDLVRFTKLSTQMSSSPKYTQHTYHTSGHTRRERRGRREERWTTEKELGSGSYGKVTLEKCTQGENKGKLRAVKSFKKTEAAAYYLRELEAIAFFSQDLVRPIRILTSRDA